MSMLEEVFPVSSQTICSLFLFSRDAETSNIAIDVNNSMSCVYPLLLFPLLLTFLLFFLATPRIFSLSFLGLFPVCYCILLVVFFVCLLLFGCRSFFLFVTQCISLTCFCFLLFFVLPCLFFVCYSIFLCLFFRGILFSVRYVSPHISIVL